MADFLGGLLSGGGGLYDDLLTPQQRDQLSSRGLLSMAGAFADAAMPSRFPVPLGAAIGKAAAAMSGGRDEAALRLLQGQKLSQEVQTMKATSALQQQFMKDIQTLPLSELFKRYNIGGAGGAPAAAGASVVPGAAPAVPARPAAAPTTAPLPPAAAALPGTPEASAALFGGDSAAGEYGGGQYDVGQGISPPPARAAVLPSLDSPITPAERLAWQKTVGPGATYLPVEDWVAQQRARAPAGGPSAQPPDAPPGAGSSLNDRYGGILAMAGGPGGASGSSLPPPDELIRQGGGPGGLLQASYTGAPPFGAGGDEVGSGASVPSGTRYTMPMLKSLAESVGFKGQDADTMAATWMGESGGNPFAKKVDAREASYGLAQINARAHPGGEQAYGDPDYAARKSYDLYQQRKARGGSGFEDWSIYKSGAYKQFLPGGGQAAGGGAPDELVGAGRGVPGFTRAQYSGGGAAPGASGGAPAAAGGGDGQGINTLLLELAKRNAMAEILKLGNPYSSMLSVLQGSPEYKGQIAGAEARATQPFTQENATHASHLKILEDMAKDNMTVDANGNIVLLPEAQRIRTMNAEQQAEAKAKWETPQEQPVYSPDGTIKIEKMNTFEFRRRAEDKARRAALGDTMPRPGDLAQTPYYRPGQAEQETQAAQAKQQLAPNGILVNDGKGGTRRVQATVAQAAAAARGEPVPELGIQGLLQPGQASQGAAPPAGTVASEPVYSETEKAIGANAARAFGEQRTAAQSAAEQIKINNESLRLLDSGLYTGWDANLALGMGRIFGIQGKDTAEKVQNTQLFVLQRMQQAADAVRAQPGSASDKDLAFMNRMSLGDITLEPSTIRQGMEIYNRFHLERIREHNRNAAGIAPGVTSGIRQTVDEPPPYERNQGNTPGGNRWQRPPGQ